MDNQIEEYKKEWLSFEEFGAIFGVKAPAVNQWRKNGKIKAIEFSKRFYRVHISELDRLRQVAQGAENTW